MAFMSLSIFKSLTPIVLKKIYFVPYPLPYVVSYNTYTWAFNILYYHVYIYMHNKINYLCIMRSVWNQRRAVVERFIISFGLLN